MFCLVNISRFIVGQLNYVKPIDSFNYIVYYYRENIKLYGLSVNLKGERIPYSFSVMVYSISGKKSGAFSKRVSFPV